jgi:hypothetical protein
VAARAEGKTARRGAGWRAWTARILSVAVLLASLLVHPSSEAAAGDGLGPTTVAVATSGADGDDGAGTPPRPDGTVHVGAHCACHMADRLDPPEHAAPAVLGAVVHPDRTAPALASRGAKPPARPPKA